MTVLAGAAQPSRQPLDGISNEIGLLSTVRQSLALSFLTYPLSLKTISPVDVASRVLPAPDLPVPPPPLSHTMGLFCLGAPRLSPLNRKALSLPILNPVSSMAGRAFFFSWLGFMLSFMAWVRAPSH